LRIIAHGFEDRCCQLIVGHRGQVRVLTAEDAASASIFDVVLPLPGVSVTYPSNDIGGAYTAALAADGLDRERLETGSREYTLTGDYRHLMARPEDLEWSFVSYADPRADLVQTDLAALRAKAGPGLVKRS
jgi:tRNA pseudouridine13 synthase